MVFTVRRVCCAVIREGVWVFFSDGRDVGIVDGGGGDKLCVWVEMWK